MLFSLLLFSFIKNILYTLNNKRFSFDIPLLCFTSYFSLRTKFNHLITQKHSFSNKTIFFSNLLCYVNYFYNNKSYYYSTFIKKKKCI